MSAAAVPESPAVDASPASPEPVHHASLDGLRAVAIGAVLLFHQGFTWAKGGYLGVDLFFVLSGYLIAGKLMDEHDRTGSIGTRSFWGGRFRRLLPAMLLVLVACSIYAATLAEKAAQRGIRLDVYSALAYVANWRFIFGDVGYFASTSEPSPVRHLWSLSVEEQFYLIFPVLLIVLLKRDWGRWGVALPVVALIAASTLWTAFLAAGGASTTRLYEGTDTRLATILMGVLAAVVQRRWTGPPAWLPAAFGASLAVMIAILALAQGEATWMYPAGQFAFAVASAVVVLAAVNLPTDGIVRGLAVAPMVFVGLISYSLYLWHWPVYLVLTPERTDLDGPALFALRVFVSLGFAVFSYRVIEQPFRLRRLEVRQPALLAVASVAAVALLVTVATAGAPAGDELAAPTGPKKVLTVPATPADIAPLELPSGATLPPAAPDGEPLDLALVGDSAAFSLDYYRPEFEGMDLKAGTLIGCGIMAPASPMEDAAKPECMPWQDKWREALVDDPDVVLMVTGAWEINDHWLDGEHLVPGTDEAAAYVDGQLDAAIATISDQTDARIAALELACAPPEDLGVGRKEGNRTKPEIVDWYNERLAAAAERHPGVVQIVSLSDRLCPDGEAVGEVDGIELRDDGTHWNEQSAPLAWEWLLPQIVEVAHRRG